MRRATASASDIVQLRTIIKDQQGLVETSDKEGFFRSDDHFHETLMRMSGRRSAWRIVMTTKAQLEKAMQGHVLAQAELVGTYEKKGQ